MALRLGPEILDPIDVISVLCKALRVVDAEVMKVRHIKRVVPLPAI